MALLTLTMTVPLLPTSNAQEYIAVPTTDTEYPWTYVLGHCTPDGNYPCTSVTEGPGPLTNHTLWTTKSPGTDRFVCANGRLYALPYAYDAATGEQLWYSQELSGISIWEAPTVMWYPLNTELAWWTPDPTWRRLSEADIDNSNGFLVVTGMGDLRLINEIDGKVTHTPNLWYPTRCHIVMKYDYYLDFTRSIGTSWYYRLFSTTSSSFPGYGTFMCVENGPNSWVKLWDSFQISHDKEYPIAPLSLNYGPKAYIMAPGAGNFTRPSDDVIHGNEKPTQDDLDFLRRYWVRYCWGACQPVFVTSNKGIMYMHGPQMGIRQFWNETTEQWDIRLGLDGAAFVASPWMVLDGDANTKNYGGAGTQGGYSEGKWELLNLDGDVNTLSEGELIQCDWSAYSLGPNTRYIESWGWYMALNMTDGTVIGRRVGSMGCGGATLDDENNRVIWNTPGGFLKCYDSVTGEQLWWWRNPFWEEIDDLRAMQMWHAYDGEAVYTQGWSGYMWKINATNGEQIWEVYTDGFQGCGGNPIYSRESNMVYMSVMPPRDWRTPQMTPGKVFALDATTGEAVWNYTTWATTNCIVADGRLYLENDEERMIICIGPGPSKTTVNLSSEQLKAGETVLISGQLLDQSPPSSGNFGAPCPDCPVTLMYCPLGGVECNTIATVTTGYAGDYYYEWTVPSNMTGMYSVIASYAGDNPSYIESSGQANFRVGEAGLSKAEMEQVTAAVPQFTMIDIATVVAIIITLALVVYSLFIRKK
jgi:outer membrane protein assembly factor BamB